MRIELIPAALVHADLLAGMHRVCFAEPWPAGSMREVLSMPGTAGLMAISANSLVPSGGETGPAGLVLWRVAADEAEILTIAILPPWRRRGIGRTLLTAAMAEAKAAGAVVMFLEVAADNVSGLALYARSGFIEAGRRKAYYGTVDALTLRCCLAPNH